MKAWSYWFPDILPHVPDCPLPLVEHELRRAAQVFLEATRAWRVIEPAVAVGAGQSSLSAAPSDTGQELVRVEGVKYDGKSLTLASKDRMVESFGAEWETHTGTPSHYLQLTPGAIRLYPVPIAVAATGAVFELSVAPSDLAEGLPDDIAIKYRDGIQVGGKARLMVMPGKTWTNFDLGVALGTAFEGMKNKGNLSAAKSFGNGRISSRPAWC